MTLEAGDVVSHTGLAGMIGDYTKAAIGLDPAKAPGSINALAQAIVDYFIANAEAYVSAGITVSGGVTTEEGVGGIR